MGPEQNSLSSLGTVLLYHSQSAYASPIDFHVSHRCWATTRKCCRCWCSGQALCRPTTTATSSRSSAACSSARQHCCGGALQQHARGLWSNGPQRCTAARCHVLYPGCYDGWCRCSAAERRNTVTAVILQLVLGMIAIGLALICLPYVLVASSSFRLLQGHRS